MENISEKFKDTIPFDPGYSALSFSFIGNIALANQEYSKLKADHQKKFWLSKMEPTIVELINKSTSFYLGCLLWGGFIRNRFKDAPKNVSGNTTKELSQKELQELDCAAEAKAILNYIESFDRDCKYFLKRPAKISAPIVDVLENYIEFAKINENFKNVSTTNDVKLPHDLSHFEKLTNQQLDKLCEDIYATIASGKIENLLEIGFYKP